jgi:hypothetical protein
MKKNTLSTIANYIKNVPELSAEYAELAAEIAKNEEKAQANRVLYAAAKEAVFSTLARAENPMTVADIFNSTENLPEEFSPSKLQYALLNYWNDEVIKHDNGRNPFTYSLAK